MTKICDIPHAVWPDQKFKTIKPYVWPVSDVRLNYRIRYLWRAFVDDEKVAS